MLERPIAILTYFLCSALFSAAGIYFLLKFKPKIITYDVPNHRSSHTEPTLRGGGISIVVVCLLLFLVISAVTGIAVSTLFFLSAALIAFVGLLDDVRSLKALPRFFIHLGVAAVLSLSGLPLYSNLSAAGLNLYFGHFAPIVFILFLTWMINAYNFMDGIDGIAGLQAVSASVGWIMIGLIAGAEALSFSAAVIAGSAAGFLFFNRSPARIFLGDVGSTFLGFALPALPLCFTLGNQSPEYVNNLIYPIAFLWMFLFDTVFTRFRLLFLGKPIFKPHREHIYQRLVGLGFSHNSVSAFYFLSSLLITVFSALGRWIEAAAAAFAAPALSLLIIKYLKKSGYNQ
ncbi:MAG TPA: glycosyltransferase family 4 protein [Pyrinomonadaceae bacterium]|nr:glycosyltransferase family 4 protein [Pyrinomonadaceae bacterium]